MTSYQKITSKAVPIVSYYRGKKLEDMTKEELIEAVQCLGHQLKHAYEDSMSRYGYGKELKK